jgi:hypothetical protein
VPREGDLDRLASGGHAGKPRQRIGVAAESQRVARRAEPALQSMHMVELLPVRYPQGRGGFYVGNSPYREKLPVSSGFLDRGAEI